MLIVALTTPESTRWPVEFATRRLPICGSLDRQLAIQRGLVPASAAAPAESPSIGDGWAMYLDYCERPGVLQGLAVSTLKRYRAVKDKHIAFCGRAGLTTWIQVDQKSVMNYARWLHKEGYADRTQYLELTCIKSLMIWFIETKKLPPSSKIDLPMRKPQGTDTYCFRPEEVAAMVMHCRADRQLAWLGAAVVALACTGVRISELAALRWSDVDLRTNLLSIRDERLAMP